MTPTDLANALLQPARSDSGPWQLERPIAELGNPAGGGRIVMDAYNQKWIGDMRPGTKLLDAWECGWSHPNYVPSKGFPDFVRLYFWKWSQPLTAPEWLGMIPHSALLASVSSGPTVTAQVPGLADWAVAAQTEPSSLMVGDGTITFEVQAETPHATTELIPLARKVQAHLAG